MQPSGMIDLERLQHAGIHRDLVLDQRAEDIEHRRHAHRRRRVEVGRALRRGAGEVDRSPVRRFLSIDTLHLDDAAVVHLVGEAAVLEHVEHAAHLLLGIVLHVLHIGAHHVEAEMRDHLAQLLHALLARGDLRLEVGDVLRRVARGVFARARAGRVISFSRKRPCVHQHHVVDQHALFLDRRRIGRHRAGRHAADIGLVAARGDEEQDLLARRRRRPA